MIYSCICSIFFFFKQKTAYEMRISDWSSDVCSSDLSPFRHAARECGSSCRHSPARHDRSLPMRRCQIADARMTASNCMRTTRMRPKKSASRRSEERRVGKECVRRCRSRWWRYTKKKNHTKKHKITTQKQKQNK